METPFKMSFLRVILLVRILLRHARAHSGVLQQRVADEWSMRPPSLLLPQNGGFFSHPANM
jgi:hypothetical protein